MHFLNVLFRSAEQVCKSWLQAISDGMLWRRLIERRVREDGLWRGLAERRGWIRHLFNNILAHRYKNKLLTILDEMLRCCFLQC